MINAAMTCESMAYSDMMHTTMDDQEFAQWVALLSQRLGLRDSLIRKSFLAQCVDARVQKSGSASRASYLELLRTNKDLGATEWDHLIDLLPLHETRFFRHESSLKLLTAYLAGVLQRSTPSHLTAWSVGCATGEEAYTLAIAIDQAMNTLGKRTGFHVIASDVSRNSLNFARRGVYGRRQLSNMTPALIDMYFTKVDNESYAVRPALREHIKFLPINLNTLNDSATMAGVVDIVFCQNVLIYFDAAQRERIVNRLAEQMPPGGLLVLGAGELLRWNHPQMKRVASDDALAFQKIPMTNSKNGLNES